MAERPGGARWLMSGTLSGAVQCNTLVLLIRTMRGAGWGRWDRIRRMYLEYNLLDGLAQLPTAAFL